ncbi:hypothetical protein GEMRC1_011986 [Eukaryota sp. GEM-RC1]
MMIFLSNPNFFLTIVISQIVLVTTVAFYYTYRYIDTSTSRRRPTFQPNLSLLNLHLQLANRELTSDDYETLLALDRCSAPENGLRGHLLQHLPIFHFNKSLATGFSFSTSCAICLDEYTEGELLASLPCPSCHAFHSTCIKKWLTMNRTCPLCKSNIYSIIKQQDPG